MIEKLCKCKRFYGMKNYHCVKCGSPFQNYYDILENKNIRKSVKGRKVILDLCGGTGAWSRPYKEAGYDVRNITLPDYDVRSYKLPKEPIYGILAAPPCTMFSFARTNAKTPRDLRGGMEVVIACLNLIWEAQYRLKSDQQKYPPLKFWALENPYYGMLSWFLGKPVFNFQPYDFGHNYQKKTALWGHFNMQGIIERMSPSKYTDSQKLPKFDYMASKDIAPEYYGKLTRTERRAITPAGFALAFYKANL